MSHTTIPDDYPTIKSLEWVQAYEKQALYKYNNGAFWQLNNTDSECAAFNVNTNGAKERAYIWDDFPDMDKLWSLDGMEDAEGEKKAAKEFLLSVGKGMVLQKG